MKDAEDGKSFEDRLKAARTFRGFGQAELATKAGLPATTISHFEGGTRKPSFENLKRLAQALEVSTDFLLGRVDRMDLGAAGDPLYRHMENLSGRDREYAEVFLKALADKGRAKKGE
jgi:transcriptional regulator with XRE-family HTH domain